MQTSPFYITKLKEDLSLRQRLNPQYSLRAYSRDLGVHSSTLSQILKGQRQLPLKVAGEVVKKLNLGPKEKTLFLESLYRTKTSIDDIQISDLDDRFMLDESYHKVLAEWEHFAVLSLFETVNFTCSSKEVSSRLGITDMRAEVVIDNLKTCGLLVVDAQGQMQKAHADVRTTEDVKSQALRDSHFETLEMGKKKLDEIALELRDFSSTTVAIDLSKMTEAKTVIREFRQKMAALLRDGDKTEVYQLAVQFYPLTDIEQKQRSLQ